MEQIEKALARARETRSSNLKQLRPANTSTVHSSANGVAPSYTETVVAAPDLRRMNEERVIADVLGHPVSDTYGLLRTQVLQRMRANGMSTLAVTSPEIGAGVTTTAAYLALAIALDVNQTVLLVDLNLREPGLHEKFRIKPTAGIDDYLRGDVELKDCLVSPGVAQWRGGRDHQLAAYDGFGQRTAKPLSGSNHHLRYAALDSLRRYAGLHAECRCSIAGRSQWHDNQARNREIGESAWE